MTTSMTMAVQQAPSARCEECPWGQCDFTIPRVRLFLTVARQAEISGEPFEAVLRHQTRNSRLIDPAVRGAGSDALKARTIGWSLDAIRKAHGARFMHPGNAEAVARLLCPERYDESA